MTCSALLFLMIQSKPITMLHPKRKQNSIYKEAPFQFQAVYQNVSFLNYQMSDQSIIDMFIMPENINKLQSNMCNGDLTQIVW